MSTPQPPSTLINVPPQLSDAFTSLCKTVRRWPIACLLGVCLLIGALWFSGLPSMLLCLQARRQLDSGFPYQARGWLAWARKLDSRNGEIEYLTARTYRIQGEMNLARQHLEQAWKLGFPLKTLEREQTLALAQSGQLHEADPALPGLLTDPRGDMAAICEAYIIGYIRTFRLGQAQRLLTAWLADSPKQPRALLLRAKMNIELLNWQLAETDLRSILDLVPSHAEAADLLAGVMLKQKQPDAALKVLPIAVKDARTRLSAQLREAECYRIQGQDPLARDLLQSILKEHPNCMEAHLKLGSLESDAGQFEPAVGELERACKLAPNSPDVRYALGIALRGMKREAEAAEHLEFVNKARAALADATNLQGDIERKPANAELRCRIGTTLLDYGQTERGLVWLHSAIEINPKLVVAHERLARYYEEKAIASDEFANLAREHRTRASKP